MKKEKNKTKKPQKNPKQSTLGHDGKPGDGNQENNEIQISTEAGRSEH